MIWERMIWRAVVPQYAIESCIVSIKQRAGLFRYRIHHRKPREHREHRAHSQQDKQQEYYALALVTDVGLSTGPNDAQDSLRLVGGYALSREEEQLTWGVEP